MSLIEPVMNEMDEKQKLMAKRAMFSAMKIVFEKFFDEIIPKVQKRADVEKEFQERLLYFGTEEYEMENYEAQKEIMIRYLESLCRQGAFPKEEYDLISRELLNEN